MGKVLGWDLEKLGVCLGSPNNFMTGQIVILPWTLISLSNYTKNNICDTVMKISMILHVEIISLSANQFCWHMQGPGGSLVFVAKKVGPGAKKSHHSSLTLWCVKFTMSRSGP